jgi:hypothetical protein
MDTVQKAEKRAGESLSLNHAAMGSSPKDAALDKPEQS